MNFKYLAYAFLLLALSCNGTENLILEINNSKLITEVANTKESRAKGLMSRDSLKSDHGMLFVFDKEQHVSFWMKNTSIPLSIAYINKKGDILEIYDMTPFSLEPVPSKRSSVYYALEVNLGYFTNNGINIGDKIDINAVNSYLKSSI